MIGDVGLGAEIAKHFENIDGTEDSGEEDDGPTVVVEDVRVERVSGDEVHYARRRRHLHEEDEQRRLSLPSLRVNVYLHVTSIAGSGMGRR